MSQNDFLEGIVSKMEEIARAKKESTCLTKHYTKSDVKKMIRQGKSDEYICDNLGASETEVIRIRAAVDAHYTMGTYSRYACRIRNRKLTEKEKENVYNDLSKGMKSEEVSEKYKITRIKAMIYAGWYTKKSAKL